MQLRAGAGVDPLDLEKGVLPLMGVREVGLNGELNSKRVGVLVVISIVFCGLVLFVTKPASSLHWRLAGGAMVRTIKKTDL